MSIIKQFREQENLTNATQVVYDNVHFPNGFQPLLDALVLEGLTTQLGSRPKSSDNGYLWINEVAKGGIKLFTSAHPFLSPQINQF